MPKKGAGKAGNLDPHDLQNELCTALNALCGHYEETYKVWEGALRRIRVVENAGELQAALEYPWEKWTVFLHPSQRALVDADFDGPALVVGSAGTGKTVVALHRAVRFAQSDASARVLLATFSRPLAAALERKVRILLGPQTSVVPRIRVASFNDIASELYQLAFGRAVFVATKEQVRTAIEKAIASTGETTFSPRFLMSEWTHVVDAWQLDSVEAYGAVPRLGRKNRMGPKQRDKLWPITDETELDDIYNTERHLFYVACTRARDRLHISGVGPGSEFLDDIAAGRGR